MKRHEVQVGSMGDWEDQAGQDMVVLPHLKDNYIAFISETPA
jgi:hypothetical protein